MIGFFIFDEKPTNKQSLVLAHSKLNENIKGYFYVRTNDCSDICSVDKGSEFFGILDDSSGFGACLFIKDLVLETDALLLQNNLHVKNDTTIDGNLTVNRNESVLGNIDAKGNIRTIGMITGNSPNTTMNLTAVHTALILAAGLSGTAASLPAVPIIMENG